MVLKQPLCVGLTMRGVRVIIGILVLGLLFFEDNLFAEVNWTARILLTVIALGVTFKGEKTDYCPSPIEIQFYDDYFVIFSPARYYDRWETRQQIQRMNYQHVSRCVYDMRNTCIKIYGKGNSTWYKYKKDGTLPDKPTKVNDFSEGMFYFDTRLATDVDFIKEIETHSPLKITVENR